MRIAESAITCSNVIEVTGSNQINHNVNLLKTKGTFCSVGFWTFVCLQNWFCQIFLEFTWQINFHCFWYNQNQPWKLLPQQLYKNVIPCDGLSSFILSNQIVHKQSWRTFSSEGKCYLSSSTKKYTLKFIFEVHQNEEQTKERYHKITLMHCLASLRDVFRKQNLIT